MKGVGCRVWGVACVVLGDQISNCWIQGFKFEISRFQASNFEVLGSPKVPGFPQHPTPIPNMQLPTPYTLPYLQPQKT
jgi:hypothetical protein